MQKNKVITFLISLLLGLGLLVRPVVAGITPEVSISKLPSYFNINSFKLSYSAISSDPASISAQFYFRKEGGSYVALGPVISGASGQVEVTSSQISDQTKYYFKVEITGASDETSSFYDISGPSPVTGYYKDTIDNDDFKIHWRNPSDTDFSKVVIYRGETVDFSADNQHEIARVSGSSNSDMTYDEHTPDPNKIYYYALRALDKADNSSSLVGDGSTTVTVITPVPSQNGSSKVTILPKESTGQVLGEEANLETVDNPSATETPNGIIGKVVKFAKDRTKITVGIIALIITIPVLYFYFLSKRK
jgi:hypothetical protein